MGRKNPAATDALVLRPVYPRPQVANVTAKAREIFREGEPLTARRTNAVGIVVERGNTDQRRQVRSDFVAEVTTHLEGIADRGQRTGAVRIGVVGAVEGDLVLRQRVPTAEAPIFGQRKAHAEATAGAELPIGRVPVVVDVVEAVVILTEQLRADQDRLVHEIWIHEAQLDRLRII